MAFPNGYQPSPQRYFTPPSTFNYAAFSKAPSQVLNPAHIAPLMDVGAIGATPSIYATPAGQPLYQNTAAFQHPSPQPFIHTPTNTLTSANPLSEQNYFAASFQDKASEYFSFNSPQRIQYACLFSVASLRLIYTQLQ